MPPDVYRVLERLAPLKARDGVDFCRVESPNTPKHGYNLLICTLPQGHEGYHVAHTGWAWGYNTITDIWEQD